MTEVRQGPTPRVRFREVSTLTRCPLWRGVRFREVSALERCPLWRGVRFGEVSVKRELTVVWSLSAQPISIQKAQSRKKKPIYLCAPREFPKICLRRLIIVKSCYCDYRMNKPFACSRCVICVSCSVPTTCAKDHGLFYLNYPQINEVKNSDHVVNSIE